MRDAAIDGSAGAGRKQAIESRTGAPADGSVRLCYDPGAQEREAFSCWMAKNAGKLNLLSFTASLAAVTILGPSLATALLLVAVLACAVKVAHDKDRPAGLVFSPDGIQFLWVRSGSESCTKAIPWQSVLQVSASAPAAGNRLHRSIDFRLDPATIPLAQRVMFCLLLRDYFGVVPFKLRLRGGGLDRGECRHQLLHALKTFAPACTVDSTVHEALNPTDPETYTALWLRSLGGAIRRFPQGTLLPGLILDNGRYEIVEVLGAGGQAVTYVAKDLAAAKAGATVVLKEFVLPVHGGLEVSARSLDHIRREYELMGRIHCPHLARYYDLFVEDHRAYLVLEHVDGPSIRQLVERGGPLARKEALLLARQMAAILMHLHGQAPPVVHRDFTPENLLLASDGNLKLIDFNLAQELETAATRTIVGKHSYIPPEQFRGRPVPESDIYAMGASLFYLLTGVEPEPISVSHPLALRPDIGADIDRLVARATALAVADRYASAADVMADIEGMTEAEPMIA